MLWLEIKLVVCGGHKWCNAGLNAMFKQFGDCSSRRNRSIVLKNTYVFILVFTDRCNDSLHAFLWNFALNAHERGYIKEASVRYYH